MTRYFFIFLLVFVFSSAHAQTKEKDHYSGGMLVLQPGYLTASNARQNIKGANFGVGGILRIYIHNCLTAGIYGGSAKAGYKTSGSNDSYFHLGYGGLFAGYSRKSGRIRYTAAGFAGGGKIKNLHIEAQEHESITEAYLYKKPVLVFSPLLSLDYYLTPKISVTTQFACLTALMENKRMMYNPVLQIGIMFSR